MDEPIIRADRAPSYRLCTACFASGELIQITIGTTTAHGANTTCVVLCADCRNLLVYVLAGTLLPKGPEVAA